MHKTAPRTILALLLVLTLGAPLLLLAGCHEQQSIPTPFVLSDDHRLLPPSPGPGAVPDLEDSPIPDVPKPVGFLLIPSESSVAVAPSGVRSVYHLYQGRATPESVQLMYRRNMVHTDWTFEGTQPTDTPFEALLFVKGPERCRVLVQRDEALCNLIIEIGPR